MPVITTYTFAVTWVFSLLQEQFMHWDTFEQNYYNTVGGDRGCRVGEVRARPYFPHARPQGFLATVTVKNPTTPFLSELSRNLAL